MPCTGLSTIESLDLLKPTHSTPVLVDTLQLISQLARASQEYYAPIHKCGARLYPRFRGLLMHPDASVRAKSCNLMGNLCRHSAFFYPHLMTYVALLPPPYFQPPDSRRVRCVCSSQA
jgi:hypothetical protein